VLRLPETALQKMDEHAMGVSHARLAGAALEAMGIGPGGCRKLSAGAQRAVESWVTWLVTSRVLWW